MTTAPFIHDDFLLDSTPARRLYHDYAAALPIIDYHCHLPPAQIAADHRFANLSEIWLAGDHYKWRAMRTNGVAERYCTGDASDWEKFAKWAETVPRLLRNPLYHWTHLELKHPFGIDDRLLGPQTARDIWNTCNAQLATPAFSCRQIMGYFKVRLVCTTDDPTDDLAAHRQIAADGEFDIQVLPTWRPDKGMQIADPSAFNAWVDRLAAAADVEIGDFASFMDALQRRHEAFHSAGCRLSDHGLEAVTAESYTATEIAAIFARVRSGQTPDVAAAAKFQSAMLLEFGRMDHARGWTQQFHIGAMRNTNSRMFAALGPDAGFDSISDAASGRPLATLLDQLDCTNQLTRTILYNLNPRDNALLASLIGDFQDGSCPGKLQFGAAWWFLDQLDGMARQIEVLSQLGLLSRFVGMVTDSRSFLSYTRHEYFRRLLCNMLGDDIARGLLPNDLERVGELVRDVCYGNAATYFGFDVPPLEEVTP